MNSLGKVIKHCITWSTCVSEQSHRQNDAAVSPAALQWVRSNESRPQRGGLGSFNHIKESIKIKPQAQGCHITSRDLTFNAEILLHGRDIIRTQFEQEQPPAYALTEYIRLTLITLWLTLTPYFWSIFVEIRMAAIHIILSTLRVFRPYGNTWTLLSTDLWSIFFIDYRPIKVFW